MTTLSTAARWVARAITAALWIVGSAYLIKAELAAPVPDIVVIAATPIVWLVVITLPILVGPALQSRQYVAAGLLIIAALVGSAYTLSGTISRQSEARDARVARASVEAGERRDIDAKRAEAEAMMARSREDLARECRSGAGKRCSGIKATISVYEAAVAGYDAKLATLKVESPAAGEGRIAAALAIIFGGTGSDYADGVALFLPALLGVTLELGALATAMFGFHGTLTVSTVSKPQNTVAALDLTEVPRVTDKELDELRRLLLSAHAPLSNNDIKDALSISKSEASKRTQKAVDAGIASKVRVGRHVAISLLH